MKKKFCFSYNISRIILIIAVIMISPRISAQDITSGLILHYSFETINGAAVNDESGLENAGSLSGNAVAAEGFEGSGVKCLGKSDYIKGPANINVGLTSFTFAAWVKLQSLKNATRFFDWGNGENGTNNFLAFIPSFGGDNNFMILRFGQASGSVYDVTSILKCPVGEWAHVAVTYHWNGSSGSGTIYLNGEAVGSNTGIPYNPDLFLGSTSDNYFGYSRWGQDTNGFDGTFDGIRLYNKALNGDDIMSLTGLSDLLEDFEQLDPGDLSAVTEDLILPSEGTNSGAEIIWTSSQTEVIKVSGEVIRPDYFDYNVILTATLTKGRFSIIKTFDATVLPEEGTEFSEDLLVCFDFSNLEGSIVKDIAEKGFYGTLVNSAKIITLGNSSTGVYNVLDTGNENGYFDMGSETGRVMSRLSEYTISAYFKVDETYNDLGVKGNCLWTFSNSENPIVYKNGYMTGKLDKQSISITPGYNTVASGNESLSFSNQALKGNWHHLAYTQKGERGTLYIDGVEMVKGTFSNTPFSSLLIDGKMGTEYNWLGKPPINGEAYLKNTLIWDFRIYSKALSSTEISNFEINVFETLADLEYATAAFIWDSKIYETDLVNKKHHSDQSFLEITNRSGFSSRIPLDNFKKMIFVEGNTNIDIISGGTRSYITDDIQRMQFGPIETGIENMESLENFILYPNPAADHLFIRMTEYRPDQFHIYSITGKIVQILTIDKQSVEINISRLPVGMYIVKRGIHTAKFIKQ